MPRAALLLALLAMAAVLGLGLRMWLWWITRD